MLLLKCCGEHLAQTANALFDFLIRGGGVVETQSGANGVHIHHKGVAGHIDHLFGNGRLGKSQGVNAVAKVAPDEKTAKRTDEMQILGEVFFHCVHHRLGFVGVVQTGLGNVCLQIVLGQIGVAHQLGQHRGMHIGNLLGNNNLLNQGGVTRQKANADTGGQNLGEGAAVNNQALRVHRLDGGEALSVKAEVAVGVVL